MKYPNFSEEKKLWKKGYKYVVGLDEAGRGPLAGPVVAGAVAVGNFKFQISNLKTILNDKILKQVKDSKQLSEKKREKIYKKLTKCKHIEWGIGVVSEKVIDKINILNATKLAMQKALESLTKKLHCKCDRINSGVFLLIDGNFSIRIAQPRSACGLRSGMRKRPCEYKCIQQKSIIRADEKVFSVAAASIIAKVTRDRLMKKYHKKYPEYGFDTNKGYGTAAHFANLEKFGPCKIHRRSFWPCCKII